MILDARISALETSGTRGFAALMEMYENNYIYMRRLVPDLDRSRNIGTSRVDGAVDLHMEVLDRQAYTTSLRLTHYFTRSDEPEVIPNLMLRVYHDARVAEVLPESWLRGFRYWSFCKPPPVGTLAWRWEVNRFLNRWLRYCLGEGHAFAVDWTVRPALRPEARRWAARLTR
ncbi:MAG: DUF1249 domain-containing protein [Nitrococcus sp.]|nr:DUF1249 domain-containing protein [Nitrococcus sp.]